MVTCEEFEQIIKTYISPLLPNVEFDYTIFHAKGVHPKPIEVDKSKNILTVYSSKRESPLCCKGKITYGEDFHSTASMVLEEIERVNNIFTTNASKKDPYSWHYLDALYQTAVIKTICEVLSVNASVKLLEIIHALEKWAQKTYEGKKIPFGFIVDGSRSAGADSEDYISFLNSAHSAAFSDGVFSAIVLDINGNVLEHKPLVYEDALPRIKRKGNLGKLPLSPSRFRAFTDLCKKSKIGILALSNGDILLFQECSLLFAKRNGTWGAYSWGAFIYPCLSAILGINKFKTSTDENEEEINKQNLIKIRLARAIYKSWLDVSFAHSGGCLAVILENRIDDDDFRHTLENCLLSEPLEKKFIKKIGPDKAAELNKKNEIVKKLVRYNENTKCTTPFFEISDKLRAELMSLDGATVVSSDGNILATGAILSVTSGSEGGGRLAATRELSKFGFAAKISEDGGITAYVREKKVLHLG